MGSNGRQWATIGLLECSLNHAENSLIFVGHNDKQNSRLEHERGRNKIVEDTKSSINKLDFSGQTRGFAVAVVAICIGQRVGQ